MIRKVIRIRAEDSPNVRLGLAQQRAGKPVTNEVLIPGVLTMEEYLHRRKTWDKQRQCVGLDAQFWVGAEVLLYPPAWLNHGNAIHRWLLSKVVKRQAKGVGIDTAAGGDKTAFASVDELGIVAVKSKKTPDTSVILGDAAAFIRASGVDPSRVCIDVGEGGRMLAHMLRAAGMPVKLVEFGGKPSALELKRGEQMLKDRRDMAEARGEYKDRRSELYGELSKLFDPMGTDTLSPDKWKGFALPPELENLRAEMRPIPRLYDKFGRMRMLPKTNPDDDDDPRTLKLIIGHSPDELEAVCLAVHGMQRKGNAAWAGVIG